MATCDSETLVAEGKCYSCLDRHEAVLAVLALLCRISQALDPMASCDPATLVADGKCFACLDTNQKLIAGLQMLCDISTNIDGGGTGGTGFVTSGDGDPVAAPASGSGFYFDRLTGAVWAYNSTLAAWVPIII